MAKEKEKEKKEERSAAEIIMDGFTKMTVAMAQDRKDSNKKFDAVFKKLEAYKVLETRFKLYEKVLGIIALAILYGIIDKFF